MTARKRRYASNNGLKKRCGCSRRAWEICPHAWFFNYMWKRELVRGSLTVSDRAVAIVKLAEVKAAIMNGRYAKPARAAAALTPVMDQPTFAVVAEDYAKRWIDRERVGDAREYHDRAIVFLASVVVPPGIAFTEKPFRLIIRADITHAIEAKRTPTAKIYAKGDKTWTRTVGGNVAGNRLRDHLSGLWNWAIGEGYADVTPFARVGGGRSAIKKRTEEHRERRLRDGEEAALLEQSSPHLRDCIIAALETGMRKGEILSLQWHQVRWLQNELHLPAGKTKAKKPRQIPISPALREVLKRRQHGTTEGPNPQPFTFGQDHYVFGDAAGNQITNIKTAWETAVLKAHNVKPERNERRRLSVACRAKLAEVDLHFHDLRHEPGSRKLEARWPLHAVSKWLGHSKIDTTSTYLNAENQLLHELNERGKLTLVKR